MAGKSNVLYAITWQSSNFVIETELLVVGHAD
jgi:hypothetical protein